MHVRDGAQQTPYLLWRLVIVGSLDNPVVVTHELDLPADPPVVLISEDDQCSSDSDTNCMVSVVKNGNSNTIIFRTPTNGRVKAG